MGICGLVELAHVPKVDSSSRSTVELQLKSLDGMTMFVECLILACA